MREDERPPIRRMASAEDDTTSLQSGGPAAMDALLRAFVSSSSDLRRDARAYISILLHTHQPDSLVQDLASSLSVSAYPDDLRAAATSLLHELLSPTPSSGSSSAETASLWPLLSSTSLSALKTKLLQAMGSASTDSHIDKIAEVVIALIGILYEVKISKRNDMVQDSDELCRIGDEIEPYLSVIMPQVLHMARYQEPSLLESHGDRDIANQAPCLEKMALSCNVVCHLACELKKNFFPWVQKVASVFIPLLRFCVHQEASRAATKVMLELLHISKLHMEGQVSKNVDDFHAKLSNRIISALVDALNQEPGLKICSSLLNALNESFKVSCNTLNETQVKAISDVLKSTIVLVTTEREGSESTKGVELTNMEIEVEEVLVQVGKCLRTLIKTLKCAFLPFFGEVSRVLIPMLVKASDTAICIFDDVAQHCGQSALKYIDSYIPYLLQASEEKDLDVSQAAKRALEVLGELGVCAGQPGKHDATSILHLTDDLIAEILIRLPPQPLFLIQASGTCKCWRKIITDAVFLDKFRKLHLIPPVLGLFHNHTNINRFIPVDDYSDGFLTAEASENLCYICLQCHHGRILLTDVSPSHLIIWDPMRHDQQLISLPENIPPLETCNAAILFRAGDTHHNFSSNFRMVFVYTTGYTVEAIAFSSLTGQWLQIGTIASQVSLQVCKPAAIVGSSCHFLLSNQDILSVDLDNQIMQSFAGPLGYDSRNVLLTACDGRMSLLHIFHSELQLYMLEPAQVAGAVPEWNLHQVIQLDTLLPYQPLHEAQYPQSLRGQPCWRVWMAQNQILPFRLVGYDDVNNTVFVWAQGTLVMMDLESQRHKEIRNDLVLDAGYPYCSFYHPASKATKKDPKNKRGRESREPIRFSLKRKRVSR